jgi:hypothetical protein
MNYCTSINLVNPTVDIYSKRIQHNLVCIFRSYILFSMIFRSFKHFLWIFMNRKETENKSRCCAGILGQGHSAGARRGPAARYGGWTPRRCGPSGSLAWPLRLPTVQSVRLTRGHGGAWSPWPKLVRRRGRPGLTDGSLVAWSVTRAHGRREGYAEQEEWQRGSPRRSDVGEVVERDWHGGILTVEDGSWGLAMIRRRPCRSVRWRVGEGRAKQKENERHTRGGSPHRK